MEKFEIIQGGMGVAVSNWNLAKAVSLAGQLGVVSGTMIDTVLARRLQDGDLGGHIRRAMKTFPDQQMTERILDSYFVDGGKESNTPYKNVSMHKIQLSRELTELIIVANYVEVFLAKEGHSGQIGINYLEKIQLPTLPSLYGAMLAGVDYVLMGAGIPKHIPGIIDSLVAHERTSLKLVVENATNDDCFEGVFIPADYPELVQRSIKRPKFFAVISSNLLANVLAKKANGKVDGFVVENYFAGGHNAPPRGKLILDSDDEPVYGERDNVDLEAIKKLRLPFWLAGSYGSKAKLDEALECGASGIQIGTPFAYCDESGIDERLKSEVIEKVKSGKLSVRTDTRASSSNYPFKVVDLEDTIADTEAYEARERICDLGYLRTLYKKDDKSVGYRCPGEPGNQYLKKGGSEEELAGRLCLCNSLLATVDYAQVRKNDCIEKPLLTAGKSINEITTFIREGQSSYSARDVIETILQEKVS